MLFVGIVEINEDPKKLNRVKARIVGFHPKSQSTLPSSDLQWANPISITGKSIVPDIGDIVYCDFLDKDKQRVVYLGQEIYTKNNTSSIDSIFDGYELPDARNQNDNVEMTRRNDIKIIKGKARIFVSDDIQIDIKENNISFKSKTPFQDITFGGLKLFDFLMNLKTVGNLGLPCPLDPTQITQIVNAIAGSTEVKIGV